MTEVDLGRLFQILNLSLLVWLFLRLVNRRLYLQYPWLTLYVGWHFGSVLIQAVTLVFYPLDSMAYYYAVLVPDSISQMLLLGVLVEAAQLFGRTVGQNSLPKALLGLPVAFSGVILLQLFSENYGPFYQITFFFFGLHLAAWLGLALHMACHTEIRPGKNLTGLLLSVFMLMSLEAALLLQYLNRDLSYGVFGFLVPALSIAPKLVLIWGYQSYSPPEKSEALARMNHDFMEVSKMLLSQKKEGR